MNPAKAAPSAPVKKAAREDPQILPGGLRESTAGMVQKWWLYHVHLVAEVVAFKVATT